jgi:pilus assembly protein CpaF
MSLADRLAQARQGRAVEDHHRRLGPSTAPTGFAHRRRAVAVDPFVELKRAVHQSLLDNLGPKLYDSRLTQSDLEQRVRQTLQEVLSAGEMPLTINDRARIALEIADDILGYGPVEPYLRDPDVSEIMVNGPDQLYVERAGRIHPVDGHFADEAHLRRTIDKIVGRVGRRVDEASPMVDARLPDGSRINAVIPPLAVDGSLLTIRKFAADPFEVDDLISFGTLTRTVADLLAACVRGRLNILVGGGTGAGKTTTLNVLSGFIPGDERVVTIEDAAELQLHQEHVLRLESRPANIEGKGEVRIRELVRNALRMRPDRIVVGEIRDAAALDMLQAMNTGHDGSICTVHANSPRDVLSRVETMVLMAGMDLPMRAIREQVASALDIIIQQQRFKDGSRRITHVTEVVGMEGDIITLQDIYVHDTATGPIVGPDGRIAGPVNGHGHGHDGHTRVGTDPQGRPSGTLRPTGIRPMFVDKLAEAGIYIDPRTFAFERYTR